MPTKKTIEFCNIVKTRSKENLDSFNLLVKNGNYGVAVGLLRQEIDSLIRVVYLDSLETNVKEKERLINDFINGERWHRILPNGKKQWITDREMVNQFIGWERIVYDFGCKLIHLSDFHSYKNNDPFTKLSHTQKTEIIGYLASYHGYSTSDINMEKFIPYLPKIM